MKNIKNTPAEITVVVPMVLDTLAQQIVIGCKKANVENYVKAGTILSSFLRKVFFIDIREKMFKSILCSCSSSLRTFVVGGAPIRTSSYELLENIGYKIINGYGETECGPLISCNTLQKQSKKTVGKAIPDMEIKIDGKDDSGNGEILVKGKGVMSGYYKDEEATNKAIDNDGWLHTGDLGCLDRKSNLYITGRLKNLIILSNGKNIYPEEIESLLTKKIEYISEVIVSTDKKQTGLYADAYLFDRFSAGKTEEELYNIINSDIRKFNKNMPSYKYIKDVRIHREPFKKNVNQKIVRSKNIDV